MLCVENVYAEVNMYVMLWSYRLTEVTETSDVGRSGWDTDTIHPVTRPCTNKIHFWELLF